MAQLYMGIIYNMTSDSDIPPSQNEGLEVVNLIMRHQIFVRHTITTTDTTYHNRLVFFRGLGTQVTFFQLRYREHLYLQSLDILHGDYSRSYNYRMTDM